MGGGITKVGVAAFLVVLAAMLGDVAQDLLGRARDSVQASELMMIDGHVHAWTIEQQRSKPPRDQAAFERAVRDSLTAPGRDPTRDRWDRPYVYDLVAERPVTWRIATNGADKAPGTGDDIVVERRGDQVSIDRDPVKIAEGAIDRKRRADLAAVERLRALTAKTDAAPATTPEVTPDVAAAWRALDAALVP